MESKIVVCFNYEYVFIAKCDKNKLFNVLNYINNYNFDTYYGLKQIETCFIVKNINICFAGKETDVRECEMKNCDYFLDFMLDYKVWNNISFVLADSTGKIIKKSSQLRD